MIFVVLIMESFIRSLRNNVYCFVLVKVSYASSAVSECKLNIFVLLPNRTSTLGIICTLYSGEVHCSFPLWKIYVWPWQKTIIFLVPTANTIGKLRLVYDTIQPSKSKLKVAMLNSFVPKSLPFKGLNLFKIFNVTYLEFSDWFSKKWDNFCHHLSISNGILLHAQKCGGGPFFSPYQEHVVCSFW